MADVEHKRSIGDSITTTAVGRQLAAMGEDVYEFGIRSEESGQMELRTWTPIRARGAVRWLRYRCMRGHHIYVRPRGHTGLILVDDLCRAQLARMDDDGLVPACVVETSPLNYQAWLRVSDQSISPDLGTAIGELLQVRYDGDPGCKDWRHFGRLAGFTNIKPHHVQENGLYPFVKLISTNGKVTPNAEQLIEEGCQLLTEKTKARALSLAHLQRCSPQGVAAHSTAFAYTHTKDDLIVRSPEPVDMSRIEFGLVRALYQAGHSAEEIAQEMLHDPSITARKKGHVEDYVARTMESALGLRMTMES